MQAQADPARQPARRDLRDAAAILVAAGAAFWGFVGLVLAAAGWIHPPPPPRPIDVTVHFDGPIPVTVVPPAR